MEEEAVGPLNSSQREIVAAQREDLERLDRMMRDLLDLTRLEAGVTPPRFELASPECLMDAAVDAVRFQAESKGVELKCSSMTTESHNSLPSVRADSAQITRVLINLINNAIRHTPAGGVVTMSAHLEGDLIALQVQDTGCGIAKEYQARIFERFVQVPGATRGGAGLGLSIARQIVRAHEGDIRVESEPGKGSVFVITLPIVKEKEKDLKEPGAGSSAPERRHENG
jgi:signal transduction histidine kinase